ncbi:MAG TPA: carboxypeptidase regulatory-like domain-containing protein [Bryobacteraceae bacterium]
MTPRTALLWIIAASAFAQAPTPAQAAPSSTGSIRGTVRDFATGDPLPGAQIRASVNPAKPVLQLVADEQGRYELLDVDPGRISLGATPRSDTQGTPFSIRVIALASGQNLTGVDIKIRAQAEIAGKIIDEDNQPVPGVAVQLVSREYSLGAVRYIATGRATTDDQGQYLLKSVDPGRSYLLLARTLRPIRSAISDAPADPKLRRPVIVPTYFPGTDSLAGAQPLVLAPSERRENVDLRITHSPSYCVDGVLQSGNGPEPLRFDLAESQPTAGAVRTLSVVVNWRLLTNGVVTGADGKFRVCDLHPGDYQLNVYSDVGSGTADNLDAVPVFYGTAELKITDKDLDRLSVSALPHVAVPGEVAWEGAAPDAPVAANLTIRLDPMLRVPRRVEVLTARSPLPGAFSFDGLILGDYALQVTGTPAATYLRDVTYGGKSILHEPLRAGSEVGNSALRVILARDGGRISATVTDKDQQPVADAAVILARADAGTEVAFSSVMTGGYTDQNGAWTSGLVQPGKYYVLATSSAVDFSVETIGKLWRARTKAQEVEIGSNATVKVPLTPVAPE